MKTCSRCGVFQGESNFPTRAMSPDGLGPPALFGAPRHKQPQRHINKAGAVAEIDAAAAARPPRACRTCKIVKGPDEYPRDRGRRDGRGTLCLVCAAEATKYYNAQLDPEELRRRKAADFQDNRATYRRYQLKRQFGITLADYEAMFEAQQGLCALCGLPETAIRQGRPITLAVDHCHTSKAVRELLCNNCNHGLGHFRDDPELMRRAAMYVEKHQREASPPT